jgi:superfamily II DNA or RNA helicase
MVVAALKAGVDRICLYSPTGGGKTTIAVELFNWCLANGCGGSFYLNRKLLIPQTAAKFASAGLPFGIRAADYEDKYDYSAPFQICSADTERSRVHKKNIWVPHFSSLVVIDEAHIQRTDTMERIVRDHMANGAQVVGLTATPIGLSGRYDKLIIPGTMAEYRACKALVPAIVRSIEQPDLSKVKRSPTGEYVLDGKKRKIYTQTIVGNVIGKWKEYNPSARPTMLYAPGVAESVFFTQEFEKIGVRWAHVDATEGYLDGKRFKLTRTAWKDILEGYKDGSIKGLSSRFKLREGIDVPFTYHCILATPIGSLASYIQTVGRVLRYSAETPDDVLVTDHGGNYLRHGSPNHDRDWAGWWDLPEGAVSEAHTNAIRNREVTEPIRCPKCSGERTGGITCPHCGFTHAKSVREVIQEDGRMVRKEGGLVKPKRIRREPDTEDLWKGMVMGWRRSPKCAGKTFAQLEGYFFYKHHYYPPRDLRLMPTKRSDWHREVASIPLENLS